MVQEVMSQEEVQDWLEHPVTRALLEHLQRKRVQVMELWVAGKYQSDNPYVTQGSNAHALGQIDMLEYVIDIDAGDMNG